MASYRIEGETLYICGDLSHDQSMVFREWCEHVMRTSEPKVVFDLSRVPRIESACVGVLSATWVDLLTQERDMEIIPSEEVRRIFTLVGFDRVFKLRSC